MADEKPRYRVRVSFADGFANVVTGLGMARAKTAASGYVLMTPSQQHLEEAYRTSTWFGKIVDIPADDATKKWRSWKTGSKIIQAVENEERRLGVRAKVRQALVWARLYGGAAIVMGGLPGQQNRELDPESVRKGGLEFLSVLSRHRIEARGYVSDPMSPYFGGPEMYVLGTDEGAQVEVHPSRVVRFAGRQVDSQTGGERVWGDPIWLSMRDSVTSADAGASVVSALLEEAKIDVVRIPDMMNSLGTDQYESILMERFRLVATLKSISNVLLLDRDDEWEQKQVQWSGIPSVIESLLIIMSGAADIPVTRLLGTSAKGLNATGEGDLKNYYDSVNAKQELLLSPPMAPMDAAILSSALGSSPDDAWYQWNSLYEMDESTRIERDKTEAETVKIYYDTGLIPDDALAKTVANRMIESGRWPGLETAIAESKQELGEQPERLAQPDPAVVPGEEQGEEQGEAAAASDAAPRTLYVSRRVENGEEILAWARGQGFGETLKADDLHVTIAYSRAPLDWMKIPSTWEDKIEIPEGGARLMEKFGEARVLLFSSNHLRWRHEEILEAGASWDHPEYQPHVTISYDPDSPDLSKVQAYQGRIVLGPEVFAEVDEDWAEKKGLKT